MLTSIEPAYREGPHCWPSCPPQLAPWASVPHHLPPPLSAQTGPPLPPSAHLVSRLLPWQVFLNTETIGFLDYKTKKIPIPLIQVCPWDGDGRCQRLLGKHGGSWRLDLDQGAACLWRGGYGFLISQDPRSCPQSLERTGLCREPQRAFVTGGWDSGFRQCPLCSWQGFTILRILVENCGRVNYGENIDNQRKGESQHMPGCPSFIAA